MLSVRFRQFSACHDLALDGAHGPAHGRWRSVFSSWVNWLHGHACDGSSQCNLRLAQTPQVRTMKRKNGPPLARIGYDFRRPEGSQVPGTERFSVAASTQEVGSTAAPSGRSLAVRKGTPRHCTTARSRHSRAWSAMASGSSKEEAWYQFHTDMNALTSVAPRYSVESLWFARDADERAGVPPFPL